MTFSKEEQAKRENGQKTVISSPNSKTSYPLRLLFALFYQDSFC